MEDKSAPVGANVVIIGGGNLSTWQAATADEEEVEEVEEEKEEEEALSENCVTEWLGLFTPGVLRVGVPFCPECRPYITAVRARQHYIIP